MDRVYVARDVTLNDAVLLGTVQHDDALGVDASYESSLDFTLPATNNGDYVFVVVTDAGEAVYERGQELNNQVASLQSLSVQHADLVGQITASPAQIASGQIVTVSWNTRNEGDAATLLGFVDRVYLSTNSTYDSQDRLLGEIVHASPLAPGGSVVTQLEIHVPVDTSGDLFFLTLSDALNDVVESGAENNNVAAAAVQVSLAPYADLSVSDVNAPEPSGEVKTT